MLRALAVHGDDRARPAPVPCRATTPPACLSTLHVLRGLVVCCACHCVRVRVAGCVTRRACPLRARVCPDCRKAAKGPTVLEGLLGTIGGKSKMSTVVCSRGAAEACAGVCRGASRCVRVPLSATMLLVSSRVPIGPASLTPRGVRPPTFAFARAPAPQPAPAPADENATRLGHVQKQGRHRR